jgi:endogenous inhibitor of DNA gyrase (YacG/DUF329 family)
MFPDLGKRAGLHLCRHTCEGPLARRNPSRADRSKLADVDRQSPLFFQACRADIRGMRDPMECHQARPCPICGRPSFERFRPFCSRRCADIDLGRWLSGGYTIATDEGDEPDAVEPQDD